MKTNSQLNEVPKNPPSLGRLALGRHLLKMGFANHDIFDLLCSLRQKGDLTSIKAGNEWFYLFCNPEHVKYILHDNHQNYPKTTPEFSPRNVRAFRSVMGDGLITTAGKQWKAQKKQVSPYFLGKVVQSYNEALNFTLSRILAELTEKMKIGQSFDIEPVMRKLAFLMIGFVIFSEDLDQECERMRNAVEAYVHQYPIRISPLHLPTWFPTSLNREFLFAKKYFKETIQRFYQSRKSSNRYPNDLLTTLMQATDERTGKPLSFNQIRDQLTTIILAGHETTASTLSWIIYLIATHADWEKRILEECRFKGTFPKHTDLEAFVNTKMVIEEALRLYPPVWGTGRTCRDGDVIDGYKIRKNSNIIINFYFLHRHPDFWEKPDEFDPMRFHPLHEKKRHEYAYLPFSAGPHACVGRQLALFEMLATIPMLLKLFKIRLAPTANVTHECLVGVRPKYGVEVILEPRSAQDDSIFKTGC